MISSSSYFPLSFLSYRRRHKPPLSGAFSAPEDLSGVALVAALSYLSVDFLASASNTPPPRFQRQNTRSFVRKLAVLSTLFDFLKGAAGLRLPPLATLCFRETYIFIYRSKLLIDYCSQSSRLWLVLRNRQISGSFHDLGQELATLLDVLPFDELPLPADVREQMTLLRRQGRRSKLYIDPEGEELRQKIQTFLSNFEGGSEPDTVELQNALVDGLGICNAADCRMEIELLEELIVSQEEDVDPSLLGGVVALTRYSRFLLFGFQGLNFEKVSINSTNGDHLMKSTKRLQNQGSDSSFMVPKDFCCPISLDLMKDPVIVSTGQTYDRASITQWIEEGHSTCPNSGQLLASKRLVPNRALHSLVYQWCAANSIPYDKPERAEASADSIAAASYSKATIEANKATARILVQQLLVGREDCKAIAACEIRLLSRTGKGIRAYIAEIGSIPLLCRLFKSSDVIAQENAVTALLNLSIHDGNKILIMEEEGCLGLIVYVLKHGRTTEARENAAATLFSLSSIHDYKRRIVGVPGVVAALTNLLIQGTPRGKKDAVMALFNLSTHPESWANMLDLGAVSALIGALRNESVAEEAAGALALLLKQELVAEAVSREDAAIINLMVVMRRGSPKGKENAVAALQEMCRRGGMSLTRRVTRMPALSGLIQNIMSTGTKRAKRKAMLLAKMFQKSEAAAPPTTFGAGWSIDQSLTRSNSSLRIPSFRGRDVSVAVPMVSVL